ncbi:MAG TPA: ATP-binding protein [Planctomycetota bacterium]|nr:ATP-binding protein [Planctomycetota bacterium]
MTLPARDEGSGFGPSAQGGGADAFLSTAPTGAGLGAQGEPGAASVVYGIFMQAPVPMAVFRGDDLVFEMANPAYLQVTGRSASELLGKPLLEGLPELKGQGFDTILHRVLQEEKTFVGQELPARLARRPGGELEQTYWTFTYAPLRPAEGRADRVVSVGIDVTDQVRARHAVESARAELEVVLEAVPAVVWVAHDPEARHITGNRAATEFLRMRPGTNQSLSSADGPRHFRVYTADGLELRHDALPVQAAARGASVRDLEEKIVFDDGEIRYLYGNAEPLRGPDGRPRGSIAAFVDITDLRRAQDSLAQQLDDLSRLHALATRLSGTLDTKTILEEILAAALKVQPRADRGFVEILDAETGALTPVVSTGFREESLAVLGGVMPGEGNGACGTCVARRARVIVEDTDTDPIFADFRAEARAAGFRAVWSTPLFGRDGRILGVLSTHFREPHRPTDREIKVVELYARQAADHLENAELYEKVRSAKETLDRRVVERTAELSRALAELETFSYSVAHDLRAPLRTMQSFGGILLDDHGKDLHPEARDAAERIVESARRMDALTRDLLLYSRVAQLAPSRGAVDLDALVPQVLQAFDAEIRHTRAAVRCSESMGAVTGDPVLIAQALSNLVSNALKFVQPGRPPEIRIGLERQDGRARLWVEDNGIGIAAPHFDKLFKVFERLEPQRFPGTGIGLAVVRKAAERMGGVAGVSSNPGQGSRFWIELPATAP